MTTPTWGPRVHGVPGRLDEDAAALLARARKLGLPPLSAFTPAEARRESIRRFARTNPPPPADDAVGAEDLTMAGPAGPLTVRLYRPARAAADAVLLFLHGGGFVVGGLDSHDAICRVIAAEAGTLVAALDYRLAPENRFPAAVEDACAALDWLAGRKGWTLGVCGDSAGGTLAAVAALHARDRGIALALQALIYPAVDQGGGHPSRARLAEGYLLSEDDIAWFGRQYFGEGPPVLAPEASPLRAPSHAGLAPALIVTCGFDPLCDEGCAYAAALAAAGVPVRHLRLESGLHGCLNLARILDSGRVALAEVCTVWSEVVKPALPPGEHG